MFGGLVVAGIVLLVLLQVRRRTDAPPSERVTPGQPVGAR